VLFVAALLAMLPVASASGAYDPLGSGTVKIHFDRQFLSFLHANRIKRGAIAPGSLAKGGAAFPVAGGAIDPIMGKGSVDTDGAFSLGNGRNRIPFKDLTVKTLSSPLIAKVGGSQLKVASSKRLHVTRRGFGTVVTAAQLRLSAKVAVRLNKKLRPKAPIAAGQLLGSVKAQTNPELVTILGQNRVTIELSSGFLAKLGERFVSVNPIFPAEHSGPTFTFPILPGSSISPEASLGILKAGGSIEFLQLSTNAQIFMQEFWNDLGARTSSPELDLEPAPPFGGKLGRVTTFGLSGGSVNANAQSRTITVSGVNLTLGETAAKAFNEAFAEGQATFSSGEIVASMSFSAQGQ
jgi:hypothetical protein